jgi:hypothetical protein
MHFARLPQTKKYAAKTAAWSSAILHQTLSSLAVGSNVVPYKVIIDHCTTPLIDRLDLNAFASINQVFHADLPGIGVTNINHCLAALPLPPTPFRNGGYLVADWIHLNELAADFART